MVCLCGWQYSADQSSGVDREARFHHARVTWASNPDMNVWWRMITEVEHDDHAPEACDSWHGWIMPRA